MTLNKKQLLAIITFSILSIIASQIDFTPFVAGRNLKFTFFDMYAPVAGGLFGSALGAVVVLVIEVCNFLVRQNFSLAAGLHLFPVMFGAWYFGSNRKLTNLIPAAAIIGFLIHPIGREVWYYSLFWLIPLLCQPFKQKSLLAKSLGATFTTHAAGGLAWVYFFNPPAAVWHSLIPVVIMERLVFVLASVIMYVILKRAYAFYLRENPGYAPAQR